LYRIYGWFAGPLNAPILPSGRNACRRSGRLPSRPVQLLSRALQCRLRRISSGLRLGHGAGALAGIGLRGSQRGGIGREILGDDARRAQLIHACVFGDLFGDGLIQSCEPFRDETGNGAEQLQPCRLMGGDHARVRARTLALFRLNDFQLFEVIVAQAQQGVSVGRRQTVLERHGPLCHLLELLIESSEVGDGRGIGIVVRRRQIIGCALPHVHNELHLIGRIPRASAGWIQRHARALRAHGGQCRDQSLHVALHACGLRAVHRDLWVAFGRGVEGITHRVHHVTRMLEPADVKMPQLESAVHLGKCLSFGFQHGDRATEAGRRVFVQKQIHVPVADFLDVAEVFQHGAPRWKVKPHADEELDAILRLH